MFIIDRQYGHLSLGCTKSVMVFGIYLPQFGHVQPGGSFWSSISSNLPPETFLSSSSAILPELVPSCLKYASAFYFVISMPFSSANVKSSSGVFIFLLFPIILCSVPLFFSFHRQLGGQHFSVVFQHLYIGIVGLYLCIKINIAELYTCVKFFSDFFI